MKLDTKLGLKLGLELGLELDLKLGMEFGMGLDGKLMRGGLLSLLAYYGAC